MNFIDGRIAESRALLQQSELSLRSYFAVLGYLNPIYHKSPSYLHKGEVHRKVVEKCMT